MKTFYTLSRLSLICVFLNINLTNNAVAHEFDRVVYPGHICQLSGVPIPGSTRRAMWRRLGNGLYNMNNRNHVYICPILKAHTNTRNLASVVVTVEDAHPEQEARCRLIASTGDGAAEGVTPYQIASGTGNIKTATIPLTDLPGAVINAKLLQMECVIPAFTGETGGGGFSGILSYTPKACGRFGCLPDANPGPIDVIQ